MRRRGGARKKDEENRVACTLSRARSQNSFARVRRDPSGFSVFRKGDWEDKFCASAGFIFFLSRLLFKEPAWSYKRGGKTRVGILRKRKRIDGRDSRNPLFFWNQNKQQNVIATTAGCGSPSSPRKRPARRKTSSRKSPKANRFWSTSPGAPILSSFSFLVGARRVGTIGLVREREKRNKVRNHSKSTQNTSGKRRRGACVYR